MDLLEFLEAVYRQEGGLVERGPDVLEAVAPEHSSLPEMVRFAIREGEGTAGSPAGAEAEALHLGHPALESALVAAREGGRLSIRHVSGARAPQRNLEAEVRKVFSFRNARAAYEPVRSVAVPWAVFHFRLTYAWDEKREELLAVGVDLQTGAVIQPQVLEKAFLEPGPLPDADRRGLERAYAMACQHLARAVEPRVQAFTRESLRHREVEESRLEDYYTHILKDLEKRIHGASPDRLAGLQAKKEQAEAERDTRRRDLEEKFRLKCSARLACLELVDVPRALVPVRLETRPICRSLRISYNLFTHDFDRLPCEGCGKVGVNFYLCTGGHLACPQCHQECPECHSITCRACEAPRCAHCDGPVCQRCSPPCAVCGGFTCLEHPRLCHEAPAPPWSAADAPVSARPALAPRPAPSQPSARRKATPEPGPSKGTSSPAARTDWTSIDRGLVAGLFTDLYRRMGGLDKLIRPIDDAVARKDLADAEWEAQDLLEGVTPRDQHLLDRLRRVLNCLKARPPQRALDRLRDLHRRLVRDGVLAPEAAAVRAKSAPSAPSPASPPRGPSAPVPSPAAPRRRPSPPEPSPVSPTRRPASPPSRRPAAPAPSPAAPSREPAAGRPSDAPGPPSPPPPTYLPVPRMSEEPATPRSRAPVSERHAVPGPPSPAPEEPGVAPSPFPPGPAGPRHFSVRVLLQQKLEASGFPKPVIAQAMHVCQLAGELVEASDAAPGSWAAAFVYLGCARSFGTALRQQDAGSLFNVSGATVSIRARQAAEFLGW